MKINVKTIQKLSKIKNSFYDALKIDLKLCEPHLVENSIFNLFEDWKESKKDIFDIANFHQKFEQIHPFQDGNGRIGRFIILKQCIENNVDLIAIDDEYNTEYRSSLYQAQTTNNLDTLVSVFEKCQFRLDIKLSDFFKLIDQVSKEVNS